MLLSVRTEWWGSRQEAQAHGLDHGLAAIPRPQAHIDRVERAGDRALAHAPRCRDLPHGQALRRQCQDGMLRRGELVGLLPAFYGRPTSQRRMRTMRNWRR